MDWKRFIQGASAKADVVPPAITPYQWLEAEFGKVDGESMYDAFGRVQKVILDDVLNRSIDTATHDARFGFMRALETFCNLNGFDLTAPLDKTRFHQATVDFLRIMEGPWERVVTAQLHDGISGISTQTNTLGVLPHVTEEGIAQILKDTLPGQEMDLKPEQIQEAATLIMQGGVYSFSASDNMELRLTSEYKRTITTSSPDAGAMGGGSIMTALGFIFRSVIYPHNIASIEAGKKEQVLDPSEAIKFSESNHDTGETTRAIFVSPQLLAVAMRSFQITPKCNVDPRQVKEGGNAR